MKPRVAIVCDWLISRGGAERVVLAMSEMFPEAPIYTTVYDKDRLPEFADKTIGTSFIQKMPLALKKHYLYLPLMPYAFEQFDLSKFDIVISSSHSCAKGIITKPRTLHICYCHSPMRYAWDNCHEYFEQYGLPAFLKQRAKKMLHELRIWDRLAAERVDFFVANSNHIKRRIGKYYRKDSTVIYPPVETEKFTIAKPKQEGQYYLAVGRITSYKRFDLLVDVFNELKLPLVVVGTGKDEAALKKKAGRFITFPGAIPDDELHEVYERATALVFPQSEDFGIIPLEAMSCGRPVIAYGDGGALETIMPGTTGLFFESQTKESLKKAILEFEAMKWDREAIRSHALKFGRSVFESNLHRYILDKWTIWKKEMAA
ncbi:glycosyltransferase [Candidatus Peregrinibacteria bacterium]|nr:glycosyltransferase [Candidatus Peregrinibacteria bacterium]